VVTVIGRTVREQQKQSSQLCPGVVMSVEAHNVRSACEVAGASPQLAGNDKSVAAKSSNTTATVGTSLPNAITGSEDNTPVYDGVGP
jgi:hypothetical protein